MCEGDRFDKLIRRAFQTCDELAFKVLRNLSQQENIAVKRRFGPYVEQMVMLLKVCVYFPVARDAGDSGQGQGLRIHGLGI